MALMACQAPYLAGVSLSRSPVAGGASSRRIFASRPSAFFAPEVQGSCSSISSLNVAPRPGVQRRKRAFVVRGLFGLGVPELAVIAGVTAIIFGPKQLPQLGKKLGESVKSFQQAAKEFETEVKGNSEGETAKDVVSEEKEKTETITPTPVATPSGSENKSEASEEKRKKESISPTPVATPSGSENKSEASEEKRKNETITPTPVATPSGTENKS